VIERDRFKYRKMYVSFAKLSIVAIAVLVVFYGVVEPDLDRKCLIRKLGPYLTVPDREWSHVVASCDATNYVHYSNWVKLLVNI